MSVNPISNGPSRNRPAGVFIFFAVISPRPWARRGMPGWPVAGHPFDIEMTKLPPGATNFPFHSHAGQWEVYLVLSGSGELRAGETVAAMAAGDAFVCPPGEAHQIKNTGTDDLLYYVIADNPPADIAYIRIRISGPPNRSGNISRCRMSTISPAKSKKPACGG